MSIYHEPVAETPPTMEQVAADRRQTLSRNITRLMESRRMSFRDLAKATGLSTTGLFKLVDAGTDARLSTLWAIADFFGVTIQSLVTEAHNER